MHDTPLPPSFTNNLYSHPPSDVCLTETVYIIKIHGPVTYITEQIERSVPMFKRMFTTRSITFSAMIAAIYAVLTIALPVLSYGAGSGWECRISEALTVLPILFPESIPGLTIGCLIANLLSPVGPLDVIFGTIATLLAAIGTYLLRSTPVLAALCPVFSNTIIIGTLLSYTYHLPLLFTMLQVGIGELAAVLVGLLLVTVLKRAKLDTRLHTA